MREGRRLENRLVQLGREESVVEGSATCEMMRKGEENVVGVG
jgi:hypothetical protein